MRDEEVKDNKKIKKLSPNNDDIPDLTCLKGASSKVLEKEINLVIHCSVCDMNFYSNSAYTSHPCYRNNLYSVK